MNPIKPLSDVPALQPVLPDDAMVIVPVRNMVLFPGMIMPVSIGRERSIMAAQYAVKAELPVGILMQRNPEAEAPTPDDLSAMGTVAAILRYVTTPDGTHHIICQGQQRFRVLAYLDGFDFMVARVERIADAGAENDREIEARFFQLKERAVEVLQLLPKVPPEMLQAV
ncbi:MAG: endopeptidase La, partial [Betaproteobacteria bacterium HGW-Betaproteobacteria-18]